MVRMLGIIRAAFDLRSPAAESCSSFQRLQNWTLYWCPAPLAWKLLAVSRVWLTVLSLRLRLADHKSSASLTRLTSFMLASCSSEAGPDIWNLNLRSIMLDQWSSSICGAVKRLMEMAVMQFARSHTSGSLFADPVSGCPFALSTNGSEMRSST